MSKNVSILQQFYINKKINNIYNTNLNDIISNIMNNIIEINILLKTSSFFEYYPLIYPRIDDLRTYINKIIISIFISILNEKSNNYKDIATMPDMITNNEGINNTNISNRDLLIARGKEMAAVLTNLNENEVVLSFILYYLYNNY